MTNENAHFVYQQPSIEFITVAAQTCLMLENVLDHKRSDFLRKGLTLLPLLYTRARVLERGERQLDGEPERFVSEQDYEFIRTGVQQLLGDDDAYLEVFLEDFRYSDEPLTAYISENLADIYQELKDLAANYQTGNEAVMNDALVGCLEAFDEHWGQKLVNVLRPMHALSIESTEDYETE